MFSTLAAVLFLAALGVLFQLGQEVRREIDELATANSDNSQWALAQSDVELLALKLAITDAGAGDSASLQEVRTRFDIFYSRMSILSSSPLYQSVRQEPDVIAAMARISDYLALTIPLIDGNDADLAAALPVLSARTEAVRADMRRISVQGVSTLAGVSDAQRVGVAQTLTMVWALTAALFLVLIVLLALLVYVVRRARARAREERRMKSRLAAIIATSLDAVVVVDAEGRVLEFNGAAEDIFGYDRDEALGAPMVDMIIPDHHRAAHEDGMKRYLDTGERRVIGKGRVQLEARRKTGEIFPVELSISSTHAGRGEIFVAFARDISHRVAAEQELIKARDEAVAGEKAKADLIAVMSHEMRTPLNGMLGTLELIDGAGRSPKDAEYLDIIRASGRQLMHHVDTVLEISRAEAGKIVLAEEPFSLSALTRELVESQRGVAEHRGNVLSQVVEMQGEDYVIGDPTRIRQVLLNLVGNAIKFTRNGAVSLEVERLGDSEMVEFRVIDDGIGIDVVDAERVFEDFVTLDVSYSRAVGGTGLGLAIVKRLVTAMGGDVWVESEKGEGSTFRVRLPLPSVTRTAASGKPAATGGAIAATEPVPPLKVLIVEDNRINRIVLRELLEQDGHDVDEAHDGQEGLAMVGRVSYDLVLMDISMPVMDGVAATRAIRQQEARGTRLPIVALTAHAGTADKDRFRSAGVDDILVKPISREGLRSILVQVSRHGSGGVRPAAAPPAAAMIVDATQMESLAMAFDPARLDALLGDFMSELEAAVTSISHRLDRAQIDIALADDLHRAAGSAALFGATAMRAALLDLEDSIRRGADIPAGTATALRRTWTTTAAAYGKLRAEAGAPTGAAELPPRQ